MIKKILSLVQKQKKSKVEYQIKFDIDFQEWLNFFLLAQKPNIIQSWSYGEAKKKDGNWFVKRGIVYGENAQPIAIFQVLYKKYFYFLTVIRINRGPLWLLEQPSTSQITETFNAIIKSTRCFLFTISLVAPNVENTSKINKLILTLGFYKRNVVLWSSGIIQLTISVQNLRSKLRSNWKRQLNASEKNNLTIVFSKNEADVEWIVEKYQEFQVKKNFFGISKILIKSLYQCTLNLHEVWIATVIHQDKKVAALLIMRSGYVCCPLISWMSDQGGRLKAGNFLLWNVILFMKNEGCLFFDHGGIYKDSKDPRSNFKRGIPSEEYELVGEYVKFSCCF